MAADAVVEAMVEVTAAATGGMAVAVAEGMAAVAAVRVHTTNNIPDWTKTKQSHTSLVHDTGLTNGHPSKRHATQPDSNPRVDTTNNNTD